MDWKFILFLSFVFGVSAQSPGDCFCSILINEINTNSPLPAPSLFLELRRVYNGTPTRRPSNSLKDWFVVIIRAHPLAVTFYADLSKESLRIKDESEFFVIGDPGLPSIQNTGISLNNEGIQSIFRNSDSARYLPSGDESPYAILLLHPKANKRDVIWMQLEKDKSGQFLERRFMESQINVFKGHIKDMVVFGRKVHASSCTSLDLMWPANPDIERDHTYILRDWDTRTKPDYSLNRCSSTRDPFQIKTFQYDRPSPGEPNPCKGVSFYAESVIDLIAPLHAEENQDVEMCSADSPGLPAGRYALIEEDRLADVREKMIQEQSQFGDSGTTSEVYEMMDISINNGIISSLGGTPVQPNLVVESQFDRRMIELATPYLPESGALIKSTKVQQWLRVKTTQEANRPIAFTCSACLSRFNTNQADLKTRPEITTQRGYFHRDKSRNAEKIRKHMESPSHKDAVEVSYKLAKANSVVERNRVIEEYENRMGQRMIPTVNMVRTVYAEALAEVPYIYHPLLVNLQQANKVELGFHHYSATSASIITKTISDKMHQVLLQHLVTQKPRFSLIVDATTNKRNIPYLISYFQTTEDGYGITYYYKNTDLQHGETAQATFTAFWNEVLKDEETVPGFLEYVKTKLMVFVSDNAKVMTGASQSFLQLLKAELKRDIVNIGCLAHKLSLVLKWAIRDKEEPRLEFIKIFEANLNDLYIYYMSRGSKRLQHLAAIALEMDMGIRRFKKNIEIRWAAGEYSVIYAILFNLEVVREDLLQIQTDNTFTKSAQEQAQKIYETLVDLPTNFLFREFSDFLQINKLLSEKFQERSGLLVDHYDLIIRAYNDFEKLKDKPGKSLQKFIESCECKNVCEKSQCTIQKIEDCLNPICETNVAMTSEIDKSFLLSQVRPLIYTRLIDGFKKYFEMNLIRALVVFDNRKFQTEMDLATKTVNFNLVCNFLKFELNKCQEISILYFKLVKELQENAKYRENFKSKPSLFWPMVLKNVDKDLPIPTQLMEFLEMFIILSSSSAEAERGFSVLARIDSNARSNLHPESLDAVLRIKLNGNKPIKKVDAFKYAEAFLLKHHMVDDTAAGKQKEKLESSYPKRFSRLF